jgi:hypothetical protein
MIGFTSKCNNNENCYRTAVRTFLCTGLPLGSGAFEFAQEPATQAVAPDNTKVKERDRSKDEPTANQQKDKHVAQVAGGSS